MIARMVRKVMLTLLISVTDSVEVVEEQGQQEEAAGAAMVPEEETLAATTLEEVPPLEEEAMQLEELEELTMVLLEAVLDKDEDVDVLLTSSIEHPTWPESRLNKRHGDRVDKNLVRILKTPHVFSV